jgi:hypothetical protein
VNGTQDHVQGADPFAAARSRPRKRRGPW